MELKRKGVARFLLTMLVVGGIGLCNVMASPVTSVQAAQTEAGEAVKTSTALAAGYFHSLLVRSDGTLWAWGDNDHGQLGLGDTTDRNVPTQVGNATSWVAVSAGLSSSLGLCSDGTLWAWGWNGNGELGLGDDTDENIKVPTKVGSATDWVAVSAGAGHSLGLRSSGTLWAWGSNAHGELGLGGSITHRNFPTQVSAATDWVAVSAGWDHSLGLRADGILWAWGWNSYGQLGLGDNTNRNVPTKVDSDTGWVAVSAGEAHSLGLRSDGTLWSWGNNQFGQLGLGYTGSYETSPTRVGSAPNWWVAVSAGNQHSLGLRSDGTLWAWGDNKHGKLGLNDTTDRDRPIRVGSDTDWVAVSAGWAPLGHSLGLKSDGSLWAWGYNEYGQLGLGDHTDRYIPTQVGSDTDWVAVSAGGWHSLGLKSDGSLWAWGYNRGGALGLGDYADRLSPTQVGSDTDWVAVSAGWFHSLGLRSGGNLWAWGSNTCYQLGLGGYLARYIPTRVGDDTDWVAVSAGSHHSLGLRSDGTLWVWGCNDHGELGLDDTTTRKAPTKVGSDTSWVAVSAGWAPLGHSLGLKSDGTLWAWGENLYWQLGLGDNTDRLSPTRVGSDTDWAVVSAGRYHSLGLKSDAALWTWGYNYYGQLGLGDTTNRNIPTRVGGDTDWEVVSAGGYHSLGLSSDGNLWAWGKNDYGQLGLGDSGIGTNRSIPNRVDSAADWQAVSAGYSHSLGLKSDGNLCAWGWNGNGQLGLGYASYNETSPARVGSATDWVAVSTGIYHSLGLRSDSTIWAWGDNHWGQLGLGHNSDTWSPTQVMTGSLLPCQISFDWGLTTRYGEETTPKTMTGKGAFSDDITGLTSGTTYHFRARAVSYYGTAYGDDMTFTTAGAQIEVSLKAGWNMVSVLLILADNSSGAVFPGVDGVFAWNSTGGSYYEPTVIEPEKGYWVAVTSNTTIAVCGTPIETQTFDLKAGWNMIGSVSTNCSIADPDDDPDGSVIPPAYWWNPVSRSYNTTTDIVLGKGYWVASVNDCMLTL
jgi:alpha-tubulin suppressor-like RCC1 family protein